MAKPYILPVYIPSLLAHLLHLGLYLDAHDLLCGWNIFGGKRVAYSDADRRFYNIDRGCIVALRPSIAGVFTPSDDKELVVKVAKEEVYMMSMEDEVCLLQSTTIYNIGCLQERLLHQLYFRKMIATAGAAESFGIQGILEGHVLRPIVEKSRPRNRQDRMVYLACPKIYMGCRVTSVTTSDEVIQEFDFEQQIAFLKFVIGTPRLPLVVWNHSI